MIVGRVVNFLVPLVFAQLVRIFEEGSQVSPWPYLGAYVGLRFLQASGGLPALRDVSAPSHGSSLMLTGLPLVDLMDPCDAIF